MFTFEFCGGESSFLENRFAISFGSTKELSFLRIRFFFLQISVNFGFFLTLLRINANGVTN